MKRSHRQAFTLVEVMIASAVAGGLVAALLAFSHTATMYIVRNLATNHSHDTTRTAELRFLKDFHEACSPFHLFTFDGTTYTDVDPAITTDRESLAQQYVSARANGVRFRKFGGGPYQLTANTTATSNNFTFNFSVGGKIPYVPQIGDKVVLPLISREFAITAVTVTPATGSPTGTVTVNAPTGVGFTIDTTTTGNLTTGYFYRSVAYSVWGGQLRFHDNFTGTNKPAVVNVRGGVTSPLPFALLYPTSTGQIDNRALRISLESYDSGYTTKQFQNGTATLQTIIPPLAAPTPVTATDSY